MPMPEYARDSTHKCNISCTGMVEQELADTNETLSDQTCQNQAIQASKMKIESEMVFFRHSSTSQS